MSCCAEARFLGLDCGMAACAQDDMEHFANRHLSVVTVKCVVRLWCERELFLCLVLTLTHHDLDDRIYDCSPTSVAAMQAEDMRTSSLFLSNLNGYHQEWFGITTTNCHGVAAIDLATVW